MMLPDFKQTARQSGSMKRPTGSQPVDLSAGIADFAFRPAINPVNAASRKKPRLVPTQGAGVSKHAAG
jgi:hypothetical protein